MATTERTNPGILAGKVRVDKLQSGKEVHVFAVRFLVLEASNAEREKTGFLCTTRKKTICVEGGISVYQIVKTMRRHTCRTLQMWDMCRLCVAFVHAA